MTITREPMCRESTSSREPADKAQGLLGIADMGAPDSQGFPGLCLHLGRGVRLTRLALTRLDLTVFFPPPYCPVFLVFETYFLNKCFRLDRIYNCPVPDGVSLSAEEAEDPETAQRRQ